MRFYCTFFLRNLPSPLFFMQSAYDKDPWHLSIAIQSQTVYSDLAATTEKWTIEVKRRKTYTAERGYIKPTYIEFTSISNWQVTPLKFLCKTIHTFISNGIFILLRIYRTLRKLEGRMSTCLKQLLTSLLATPSHNVLGSSPHYTRSRKHQCCGYAMGRYKSYAGAFKSEVIDHALNIGNRATSYFTSFVALLATAARAAESYRDKLGLPCA